MCGGFSCKKRNGLHFGIRVVVEHIGPVVALVALQVYLHRVTTLHQSMQEQERLRDRRASRCIHHSEDLCPRVIHQDYRLAERVQHVYAFVNYHCQRSSSPCGPRGKTFG
jgi:hypothetical protein